MAIDLVKLLKLLDVNLDLSSEPIVPAGMITWLGRMYDIHPDHIRFGFTEGMEIWITGTGLAKLDLAGFETWLMDAPRGNHLLISERQIAFDSSQMFTRNDRNVVLWTSENLSSFIGQAILQGKIQILDEEEIVDTIESDGLFHGNGPFAIRPKNDFTILDEYGLKISHATPVLIPGVIHNVKGKLVGPATEEIEKWVLNCKGLHLLDNFELMERAPLLHKENLEILENPKFSEVLSERKIHGDEMGQLLHWWHFDDESCIVENYNVLIPGHTGVQTNGKKWVLEGLTNSLHLNI